MTVAIAKCVAIVTLNLCTTKSVAIVTLNLCAIIVFRRNRNLRKRSTYLVINLAVIDMFVGGVAVCTMFYVPGVDCNLWKWHSIEDLTDVLKTLLLLWFINKHHNHCFSAGARNRVLAVQASCALEMGIWINNCCSCLGYSWVDITIFYTCYSA